MAKEAIDRIKEAEVKADVIRNRADSYFKQTMQKAEDDKKALIEEKRKEAAQAAEVIIEKAKENAEKYIIENEESGKKELHVLKETVLERQEKTIAGIIKLL